MLGVLQEVGAGDAVDVEEVDDEIVGVGSLDCPSPTDLKREVSKKNSKMKAYKQSKSIWLAQLGILPL